LAVFVQAVLKQTGRKMATLPPEASVAEAAELLAPRDVQIIVVCDQRGKIVGVVTDSDIVRDLARCRGTEQVCAPNIAALMSRDVVSCRPQDRIEQVLSVMKARGLRRIPVVDDIGGLAGLITMRDALQFLYAQAKLDEESLKEYFLGTGFH
jgi:CBS domain-containing protein